MKQITFITILCKVSIYTYHTLSFNAILFSSAKDLPPEIFLDSHVMIDTSNPLLTPNYLVIFIGKSPERIVWSS